jgi:single-stranded-DNA-specific exonuclease
MSLGQLIDIAALGTVADCVSLQSMNNRVVVKQGLELLSRQFRPAWQAYQRVLNRPLTHKAELLSFGIGPHINAKSRLGNPMAAFDYLNAANLDIAQQALTTLVENNQARKAIEKDIHRQAITKAQAALDNNTIGLAIFLEDSHSGIHGIIASRLVDYTGHPVIMLTPTETDNNIITGSARSAQGLNVKAAFEFIQEKHPSLFIASGGHGAAGGCKFLRQALATFMEAFNQAAIAQLGTTPFSPTVEVDGTLLPEELCLDTVDEINALEPFGTQFEAPRFLCQGQVVDIRPVGNPDKVHLKITLLVSGTAHSAIWFNALDNAHSPLPVTLNETHTFIVTPTDNNFRGIRSFQLLIHHKTD